MDALECVTFTRGDPRKQEQIYGLNTYQVPKLVVHHEFNEFPNIIQYDDINPTISSPNALCDIQFYMTKETLLDAYLYRQFIGNAVSRFRGTRDYKATV